MFYLPADAVLPGPAWLELESPPPGERVLWGLELVPVAGAPAPEPAATVVTGSLRIAGRRLRVRVACPAAAVSGCSGTLTLRSARARVARLTFARVAAGTTRTLRARVARRHRFRSLRAVLATPGRAPVVTRLRLR
jgi:hypothetical protein